MALYLLGALWRGIGRGAAAARGAAPLRAGRAAGLLMAMCRLFCHARIITALVITPPVLPESAEATAQKYTTIISGSGQQQDEVARAIPTTSGPVDAWTARWHGAVGEPFEVPWSTRLLWKKQGCPLSCHLDWNDGAQMMPRGPVLGQGDLGMTVISEQLPPCSPTPCAPVPSPGSPASGVISLHLGANQLWAVSDNDWSKCHYDEPTCRANGQSIDLVNESANGAGCSQLWLPGCRHSFPRRVGFGGELTTYFYSFLPCTACSACLTVALLLRGAGLNISSAAFTGPSSRFMAEQRMRDGVVSAGYVRSDGAKLTATSLMDDAVKSMLTDLTYNFSSSASSSASSGLNSSISVKLALWTFDMAVNASFVTNDNYPSTHGATAASATAAIADDGLPYV